MKERIQPIESANIIWPQGQTVVVKDSVDFAYIMRKDGAFTIQPIVEKYAAEYSSDVEQVNRVMHEEYDTFFSQLTDLIGWGFVDKGNVQLHLYDPDYLENAIRNIAGDQPMISLDPLMTNDVYDFKVSRAYYPSGKEKYNQVERPGSISVNEQAAAIFSGLTDKTAAIVEDDIFTGGSVIQSAKYLKDAGVHIDRSITGLLIGDPPELREMGIEVVGAVTYQREDQGDIFDKVDLGDPRDFLVGASGLVVKLPNGELSRAPYILPFVSANARVSIPKEKEQLFSERVLQANYTFFNNLDAELGNPICIRHMDPHFASYMYEQHGIPSSTPMVEVVAWMLENNEQIWNETEAQGKFLENLDRLQLPKRMVLLDVNGTLIPDDSVDGSIPEEDILEIQKQAERLNELGIKVGLCSDSPLPQLIEYAAKLGIDGPIIAENGNIIYFNGEKIIVGGLEDISSIKKEIELIAEDYGYVQTQDCIAQEFGGDPVLDGNFSWSFGANRETSVTLFGHSDIMRTIADNFFWEGISVDCNPEYPNSIALHSTEYKKLKGATLSLLARFGYSSLLVGNSYSDWVAVDGRSHTAFVGNASVSDETKKSAVFTAEKHYSEGVVEILENIS